MCIKSQLLAKDKAPLVCERPAYDDGLHVDVALADDAGNVLLEQQKALKTEAKQQLQAKAKAKGKAKGKAKSKPAGKKQKPAASNPMIVDEGHGDGDADLPKVWVPKLYI